MPRDRLIQYRRGTHAAWAAANPVLASGEPGIITDRNAMVIGDGSLTFNALTPIGLVDEAQIRDTVDQYLEDNPPSGGGSGIPVVVIVTGNEARPDAPVVHWVGSIYPTLAEPQDTWYRRAMPSTVAPPTAISPAISALTLFVDQPFAQQFYSDGDEPLTWTGTSLPAGLALVSGYLAGTPTTSTTYATVIRSANAGGSVPRNIAVTVYTTGWTTVEPPAATAGQAYSVNFRSYTYVWNNPFPPPIGALTVMLIDGSSGFFSSGLSFDDATGVMSGTPTMAGTHTVTLRAERNGIVDDKQFTITIGAPEAAAPVVTTPTEPQSYTAASDNTRNFFFKATGIPQPTVILQTQPGNGTNTPSGTWTNYTAQTPTVSNPESNSTQVELLMTGIASNADFFMRAVFTNASSTVNSPHVRTVGYTAPSTPVVTQVGPTAGRDVLVTDGMTVPLSVTSANATSYQWRRATKGQSGGVTTWTWTNVGTNSNTHNVVFAEADYVYQVLVTNASGTVAWGPAPSGAQPGQPNGYWNCQQYEP